KRLLVCVSGGMDSVALLDMCADFSRNYPLSLSIFHLNHGTRNGESDRDALFVSSLADRYRVPLYSFSHTFVSSSNFEEAAREVRYRYIAQVLDEQGIDYAATAHTQNDSVETTLMRLFTGTSLYGLRGIDRVSGRIIRPLLDVTASRIKGYCAERKLAYVYDSSNSNTSYDRNYMRRIILPPIEQRYPVYESVSRLQHHAETAYRLARKHVLSLGKRESDSGEICYTIPVGGMTQEEMSFLAGIILREDFNTLFTSAVVREIVKKMETANGQRILYRSDTHVLYMRQKPTEVCLYVLARDPSEELAWNEVTFDPDDDPSGTIDCSFFDIEYECITGADAAPYHTKAQTLFIDADGNRRYTVRGRQNGDTIRNGGHRKRLKKVFIDRKLSARDKSLCAVLVSDGIVAGVLFPDGSSPIVADGFRPQDKTKKILAIRYAQKYEL
ncbi:MAG: tRNA lysidine(34) synthetase TilS, partial [Spirochaetota bacterium]